MPDNVCRWVSCRKPSGKPGGTVFDPCAGFGGRLLGAVAAEMHYAAIDANPAVITGLTKFIEYLREKAPVLRLSVTQGKSEILDGWVKSDLVFTSPPYFNAERYSGKDQSVTTYPTYTEWREGFLSKIVLNAAGVLNPEGKLVLVVRDVKRGNYLYPIEKDTELLAAKAGFVLEESLAIKLPGRKSRPDRLLAFRRS